MQTVGRAGDAFTEDIYRDAIEHFKDRQTVVKALCLHIAHDCNLACRYCFAEEGEYHGRRALMSFEVGKKGAGLSDCKFRKQEKPGGGFLRRRASDELAGGKRPGGVRQRAGEKFTIRISGLHSRRTAYSWTMR